MRRRWCLAAGATSTFVKAPFCPRDIRIANLNLNQHAGVVWRSQITCSAFRAGRGRSVPERSLTTLEACSRGDPGLSSLSTSFRAWCSNVNIEQWGKILPRYDS